MPDVLDSYEPMLTKPPKSSAPMEYMRSIQYVFENPNWIVNLLFVGLCLLSTGVIPVVGQLVSTGYQFEVLEALHRRPGSQYPDFDMNKLLDYLLRGFWVFLVGLVILLAAIPVLGGFIGLAFAVGAASVALAGDEGGTIAAIVMLPIGFFVLMAAFAAIGVISTPFTLRAALMQDFGAAFDFGFARQFIQNTWKEMIVCVLFSMVAVAILSFVGLAMLCVGVYLTMSIVVLMQAHLVLQLYELHLSRGGEAIPIQPAAASLGSVPR